MKSLSLSLSILTITTLVFTQTSLAADLAKVPLKVVPLKQFCTVMTSDLTAYAIKQGASSRTAVKFSGMATQSIQKQLQSGDLDPFYDVTSLEKPATPSVDGAGHSWLDAAALVVHAMGVNPRNTLIVNGTDELKMVSQVQPGSQLLVIVTSMGALNPERAQSVVDAAGFAKIQINIIWVGSHDQTAKDALSFLAGATGGAFVDFSSRSTCPRV